MHPLASHTTTRPPAITSALLASLLGHALLFAFIVTAPRDEPVELLHIPDRVHRLILLPERADLTLHPPVRCALDTPRRCAVDHTTWRLLDPTLPDLRACPALQQGVTTHLTITVHHNRATILHNAGPCTTRALSPALLHAPTGHYHITTSWLAR